MDRWMVIPEQSDVCRVKPHFTFHVVAKRLKRRF